MLARYKIEICLRRYIGGVKLIDECFRGKNQEKLAECTEFAEKFAMKNFELKEKKYDSAS